MTRTDQEALRTKLVAHQAAKVAEAAAVVDADPAAAVELCIEADRAQVAIDYVTRTLPEKTAEERAADAAGR